MANIEYQENLLETALALARENIGSNWPKIQRISRKIVKDALSPCSNSGLTVRKVKASTDSRSL
jgi:hypothetical protein